MLLNCHTIYSFCYGTYSPEELIQAVKNAGFKSYVLSDINNTSAVLDSIRIAEEEGIKAIPGIDFRNGNQHLFTGIAINNEGFKELNAYLSGYLHSGEDIPTQAPEFHNCFVVYPFRQYKGAPLQEHEFIGIHPRELTLLPLSPHQKLISKMVILHPVSFQNKTMFNAHRLLRAIDKNVLLSRLAIQEQGLADETLVSPDYLQKAFAQFPEIIDRTRQILAQCLVKFDYGKLANKNLRYYSGTEKGDIEMLRSECMKNLYIRYPNPDETILNRVEKELQVITQLGFASYFLINWDIITYARHKNYYYVGRGSGANSILAYLLRITDVDPIELDLYFERFINIYRNNAPDFDMDFSWTDRDNITEYIFRRFGRHRTALLGAYNTFQHDAVIRETGKVFGLPPAEIDALQRAPNQAQTDTHHRTVLKYSQLLKGLPSHLSIHSSGIIISEEPIFTYTATSMPPKGYPLTQFSMLEAEDIGLYKFDILSQRGLGKIKDTLDIVKANQNIEIDIHDIPKFKKDKKVKELLKNGQTIGCFYVESPAMRMLLTKLRADDYLRLVAASSIIRPGVAKSGMMREYIMRYRHPELREKARAHAPEFYSILEETYGVMVYQEDVIKIAHLFAGLTLAESDYLRRGMSWKFKQRNEFWKVKESFFKNCIAKGHPISLIEKIWTQIESFANYAFSKGHSASYAVESFQALYLKAYFPLEYMVATINNGGGFYRKDLYVHEARMNGAAIHRPCINICEGPSIIRGKTIYLGLSTISSLESASILNILEERDKNGAFANLAHAVERLQCGIEQMRILIRAGAFAFTGKGKKELLWELHSLMPANPTKEKPKSLFPTVAKEWKLPGLTHTSLDDAYDDMELFGFTLDSPFDMLKKELPPHITASQFHQFKDRNIQTFGFLIHAKRLATSKGERMSFGTFVDIKGHWIDTVHFPPALKAHPFTGPGVYAIDGKVVDEYEHISLEVTYLKRLELKNRD